MDWLIWVLSTQIQQELQQTWFQSFPPSKGHGYDIYTELGTDKVLVYGRFDDSTDKDFPVEWSQFCSGFYC